MSNCNSASLIYGCCCAEDVLRLNLMDIDRPVMARRCGSSPTFRLLLSSDKKKSPIYLESLMSNEEHK